MSEKTTKTLFAIVSIFLLLESLNALSVVQDWHMPIPAPLNFKDVGNNWVATFYAVCIIGPTLLFVLVLGLYYFGKMRTELWVDRIPDLPKFPINTHLRSGKIFKLCIIFLTVILPLIIQLVVTNKFFYGTVRKDDTPFSCGYFIPKGACNEYDQLTRGHLQYVPWAEINSSQFKYGKSPEHEGVDYIPFWEPWFLLFCNLVLLILFSFYTYSIFKRSKVKQT